MFQILESQNVGNPPVFYHLYSIFEILRINLLEEYLPHTAGLDQEGSI